MGIKEMINPAGGLHHHLNAWKYKKSYWCDFKFDLNQFLTQWSPKEKALLIVGASGGYTLDRKFLSRFDSIAVIDPDPLAKWLFQLRFKIKVNWDTTNYKINDCEQFFSAICKHDKHAILFSNFLGQIPLLKNEDFSWSQFKVKLHDLLKGKSWCSYHDLYSLPVSAKDISGLSNISTEICVLDYLRDALQEKTTVNDHETLNLLPCSEKKQIFLWQRKPKVTHIIEGRFQN